METYITICKIDCQWGTCCMAEETQTGALGTNLEGWDVEGGGRQFQKGEDICIPMADSR